MKPVQQVFALVLEDIPAFKNKCKQFTTRVEKMKYKYEDMEKYQKKVQDMRNKEIKALIFDEFVRQCDNIKNNQNTMFKYFS
jgi:hypothetical protein